MTIAAVLVLVLAYLVITLSRSGVAAQDYSRRMNRVTEIAQELTELVREEIQSSVRLFGNDAIGNAYRGVFDLTAMPVAIDTTRFSAIETDGVFEPDQFVDNHTGNALCFARYAWSDDFTATSGTEYRIDVYRIAYFYLTAVDGGPRQDTAAGLNLAHWVSEPLADGNQIDSITNATDREEVCEHLRVASPDAFGETHAPVQVAWAVGEDPTQAGTLRQIEAGGTLSDTQAAPRPTGAWRILGDPRLSKSGLLHYRHHAVASNFAPRVCGVGRFGYESPVGDGFPHGFEVQIVGPSSARQILVHATLVSTRPGRLAYHDVQIISDARDL